MTEISQLYVLFELNGESFAVAARYVKELAVLGSVFQQPASPPHRRGIMLLRGQALGLVDLRILLGMSGHREVHRAAIETFKQRKQDHIDWLDELEASVRESRRFELTLDPHACQFGRWYDHFETEDPVLSLKLRQFDRPHQRIHALGAQVRSLVDAGQQNQATALIQEQRKKEFVQLIELFDETVPLLEADDREIVMLLSDGSHQVGVIVDKANEMREINPQSPGALLDYLPAEAERSLFEGIGLQGQKSIVVLAGDRLLREVS
jgi:chemotaxis signal transduction protein